DLAGETLISIHERSLGGRSAATAFATAGPCACSLLAFAPGAPRPAAAVPTHNSNVDPADDKLATSVHDRRRSRTEPPLRACARSDVRLGGHGGCGAAVRRCRGLVRDIGGARGEVRLHGAGQRSGPG